MNYCMHCLLTDGGLDPYVAVWPGPSVLRTKIRDTVYASVLIYTELFGSPILSKLLTLSDLAPDDLQLAQWTGLEGVWLILAIMAVFLVLGCVMDSMAIILILVPLFAPIVVAQGFDLV